MKYLKTYEDIAQSEQDTTRDEPQIGDYAVVNKSDKHLYKKRFIDVIDNNIGEIIDSYFTSRKRSYMIKYDFSDLNLNKNIYGFDINEIEFFSPNKEDCQIYLNSKKYNL